MPAIAISAFIGAATLAGGLAGLFLQSFLPEKHTTDRSRDMLAAIVGLISLLLALVLGTLIGSAYSFYSTQKSEMENSRGSLTPTGSVARAIWAGGRAAEVSASEHACGD